MDVKDIEKALEGLRKGLRRDGADLIVSNVGPDEIELSLTFGENTCLECIVGTDILLAKIRLVLSKVFREVPAVVLHDPRSV